MNIKPILFSTPMVQAIMNGKKSMTRRVVSFNAGFNPNWTGYVSDGAVIYGSNNIPAAKAKYKQGDILWVRETWANPSDAEIHNDADAGMYLYKADYPLLPAAPGKWRPSIFMPKDAARIFLRVKNVRAERLQDISNEDAIKEGFEGSECSHPDGFPCTDCLNSGWIEPPRVSFAILWEELNGARCGGVYQWGMNPYVWVIEFEQCEKPEGWCGQ